MQDLKDPEAGQVSKEDAEAMYEEWKNNQDGFIDPDLLQLLLPWWLTQDNLSAPACELDGSCNSPPPSTSTPNSCPN